MDPKDQKPAGTPDDGAPKAGAEGSEIARQLEELKRRQEEADRKVTELVNEKALLERRLEEVSSVRQPQHQQVNSPFVKPFEDVALGNTQQGAQAFEEALEQKAREMEQRLQAQAEAKAKYEGHIAKVRTEKPFASKLEETLKMNAIVNFQRAQQLRKPITPEQAYDEAVSQMEKTLNELNPKPNDTPAPKGALGEKGGSGQNPNLNPPKDEGKEESPTDYVAARKAKLLKMGM